MPEFEKALAEKDFVVTVELDPPRGVDLKPLQELAAALGSRIDAVVLSANRAAKARMNPLLAAQALAQQGSEVILTLTCRDYNRLALASDLLAAKAAGVNNLLLVSGDHVTLGDQPEAKPVYDLDSTQALQMAVQMAQGRDMAGQEMEPVSFFLGAAAAPRANPLAPQVFRLHKKTEAGASFFITQPLSDLEQLKNFVQQIKSLETKVIAGVEAASPEDLEAAANLCREIKASKLAAGVHLSAPDHQDSLTALLDKCGL